MQHILNILTRRQHRKVLTADAAVQMIRRQIHYILHDPHISKARKMPVTGQFQNAGLAALQTKQNYTDVMQYFTGLLQQARFATAVLLNAAVE